MTSRPATLHPRHSDSAFGGNQPIWPARLEQNRASG